MPVDGFAYELGITRLGNAGGYPRLVAYEVRTDVYEGPFDVLLRLISAQEVDLYEIRLSDIVDAYLAELENLGRLDLEVATEFLLIAAILVELKSRRLLPDRGGGVSEDDLALLEERDYLLARLVECTTFAAAGKRLAELEHAATRSVARGAGPDERFEGLAADLLGGVTVAELCEAAGRALSPKPEAVVEVEHILVDEVTVAEVVGRLLSHLPRRPPTTFRSLTEKAATRIEVVVHFLALLELYKQGHVELEQAEMFGEMVVSWIGDDEVASDGLELALAEAEYRG